MLSLTKKENGNLELTKRNTISFHNLKKKHLETFNKFPTLKHHPLLKTL